MPELHETRMGQKLLGNDIPRLIKALERIADALERIAPKEEEDVDND